MCMHLMGKILLYSVSLVDIINNSAFGLVPANKRITVQTYNPKLIEKETLDSLKLSIF